MPVFSIHNADVGNFNSSLYFDAATELVPHHHQYLILGFDDVNANIFGIQDSGIPTIWALVAGLAGSFRLSHTVLGYETEVVATHYLWGSFHDAWALGRSVYRLRADGGSLVLPLTSPYGPGRISWNNRFGLDLSGTTGVSLTTLLLGGDPQADLVSLSYSAGSTSFQFLLLRIDVAAEHDIASGLSLTAGAGADLLPDGWLPRLSVGGRWTTRLTFPRR